MAYSKKTKGKRKKASSTRRTYKGRKIVIRPTKVSAKGEVLIEVDGQPVEVYQAGPNEFHSIRLPYAAYSSLLDLAKGLIDHEPSFRRKLDA